MCKKSLGASKELSGRMLTDGKWQEKMDETG